MKSLVTGGAGFIGSNLVHELLSRGDEVIAVDSFTPYYDVRLKEANWNETTFASPARLVRDDLMSIDLVTLLLDVDVVYHQAAQPGVRGSWGENFATYTDQNVLATQRLLEACLKAGISRFVYASSSSVYGSSATYPTQEDQVASPVSPYGVTKLAAEHLVSLYARNFGLRAVSLRYHSVYGPRQRPDMAIHRLLTAALTGAPFPLYGSRSHIRDFTFVSDIVSANLLATSTHLAPGTVMNLAGGSSVSIDELMRSVGEITGKDVPVVEEPAQAGDVTRTGGSIGRAKELMGWEPVVDLYSGLEEQWRAIRNRGVL